MYQSWIRIERRRLYCSQVARSISIIGGFPGPRLGQVGSSQGGAPGGTTHQGYRREAQLAMVGLRYEGSGDGLHGTAVRARARLRLVPHW